MTRPTAVASLVITPVSSPENDPRYSTGNGFFPGAATLFDFEAAYDVSDSLSVLVGLQNAFDTYPDINPSGQNGEVAGLIYPESSPFGFNGGYYYMRATWQIQ